MEVQHGIKCLVLPMDLSITDALKEIQQQNLYWHSWHPNKKKKTEKTDKITITPACTVFLSFIICGKPFQIAIEMT